MLAADERAKAPLRDIGICVLAALLLMLSTSLRGCSLSTIRATMISNPPVLARCPSPTDGVAHVGVEAGEEGLDGD
jgi:hypothetical protein